MLGDDAAAGVVAGFASKQSVSRCAQPSPLPKRGWVALPGHW